MDHLYRTKPTCHIRWAYPAKEDVQVADIDQILQCKVVGESDVKDPRNTWFTLANAKDIQKAFRKHILK